MIVAPVGDILRRACEHATQRGLTRAAFVRGMVSTGNHTATHAVLAAEPAGAVDLVGPALRGARREVDEAT